VLLSLAACSFPFAQRPHIARRKVGMAGSGSDGGRISQHRAPFATLGEADLDGNAGDISSRKAPAGLGLSVTVNGRSERHFGKIDAVNCRTQVGVRHMDDGAASSEEPMRFPARSISSAPVTHAGTMRTFATSRKSASSRQDESPSGKPLRWTDDVVQDGVQARLLRM